MTSGGMTGSSSQDHRPLIASQILVKTRVAVRPPLAVIQSAAALHVRRVDRVARQLERHVGLDRGGQVARAAVEVGPGAVLALL